MLRSYKPRARVQPRVLLALLVTVCLLLLYLPSSEGPTPTGKGSAIWDSLNQRGLSKLRGPRVGSDYSNADTSLIPCNRITKYVKGISGVTVWENLYWSEGIFYAVSPEPMPVPARSIIAGLPTDKRGRYGDPEEVFKTIPPDEATEILGLSVIKKDGLTMYLNDRDNFSGAGMISHYYHWAELFISGWRVLASAYGKVEPPRRILFREQPQKWRDHAGLNAWILMTALPSTTIEEGTMFTDMVNSKIGFMFEKLVIIDRVGCHAYAGLPAKWNKMSANLPTVDAPQDWWAPIRNSFKRFLIAQGCEPPRKGFNVPVVTYVNRQATERRLTNASHDSVVEELNQLEAKGVIELANWQMEHVPRTKQFCQVLRTDILIGVHGNGMSHQLWMRPGSAVIEFMNPPGFAMDYALPAQIMNHQYFAIHNDSVFTESQWQDSRGRPVLQGPTFHSKNIPLHGPFIGDLLRSLAQNLSSVPDEW